MTTPKTKLTVETSELSFGHANREILRITAEGNMIIGEGLSADAATQETAKLLIAAFKEQIQKMVDARIAAMKEDSK